LLNNGDGTFADQIVVPAGTRVDSGTVADVNGDGLPDLIIDNYAADSVWVLLGKGDNTFQAPTIYPTKDGDKFQAPGGARAVDVNGDGFPDLIYATYVGEDVVVRLGKGDGTFGPERKFATRAGSYGTTIADFNGDGIPDLAVNNTVDSSVSVLLG